MTDIIKILREQNGYSQAALAEKIGVSRQMLSKYESGETPLSVETLQKLSKLFDVPYSCFIDNVLPSEPTYTPIGTEGKTEQSDMRISIPIENIRKFKEVLLYVLGKVGAKPNVGQAVLYKLLYFIDFDYYELYEEQLMGAKYIKNTYGPMPVDFAKITRAMESAGDLEEIHTKYFNHDQTKYLPRREADLSLLSAREIKHIDAVLAKHADKTAKEISDFSHKDVPWIGARERQIIEYDSVFYRTPETSVREYNDIDD